MWLRDLIDLFNYSFIYLFNYSFLYLYKEKKYIYIVIRRKYKNSYIINKYELNYHLVKRLEKFLGMNNYNYGIFFLNDVHNLNLFFIVVVELIIIKCDKLKFIF